MRVESWQVLHHVVTDEWTHETTIKECTGDPLAENEKLRLANEKAKKTDLERGEKNARLARENQELQQQVKELRTKLSETPLWSQVAAEHDRAQGAEEALNYYRSLADARWLVIQEQEKKLATFVRRVNKITAGLSKVFTTWDLS